jgi:hypothetical protein
MKEPDSADTLAFASSAEQISLSLFELYLSLHELSKYKIYVNETFVLNTFILLQTNTFFCLRLVIDQI